MSNRFTCWSGKHSDDNNKENPYLLTLGVNGTELKSYLPNLPQLPRNTHVVVNITINEHAMDCIVDVRPYTEITLEPEFRVIKKERKDFLK